MTEKELRKLKRSDFLQLLLTQGKEMSEVQTRLDETTEELGQLKDTNERLKTKLDEKDGLIEKLNGRLEDKEATLSALRQELEDIKTSRRIELEEYGSIAMAALSLNGIFEVAQEAADQYLYNIRVIHDEMLAKRQAEIAKQEQVKKALQTAYPAPQTLTPELYSVPQAQPKPQSAPQAQPESQSAPQAQPEPQPAPQVEPEPQSAPQAQPEPQPAPQAQPESYSVPQTPKSEPYSVQKNGLFDRLFGRGTR